MPEHPEQDRGKCISCGFLSKRTKRSFGSPVPIDYEATSGERSSTPYFFVRWNEQGGQSSVDFACFRDIADISIEYRCEVDAAAKTTAAMLALEHDRKCEGWYRYKPGFSPMKHFEWYQEEERERRWEEFEKWMEIGRRDFEERLNTRAEELHTALALRDEALHTALADSQRAFALEREKMQEPTSKLMKRLTVVGIVLASVQVIAGIAALTNDSLLSKFTIWMWRRIFG